MIANFCFGKRFATAAVDSPIRNPTEMIRL